MPDLLYIDDYLGVSTCGRNSVERNLFITKSVELKKLNFNVGKGKQKSKCQQMHVGTKNGLSCPSLVVRGKPMECVTELTYLGSIVTSCGTNITNIRNRVSKGIRIIGEIFTILESVSLGNYFFKIALLLRETMLLNAVLYNLEV